MIDIRQLPGLNITQKDFIEQFYAEFNYAAAGSGLNRHFARVEPLLYQGVIGGEFIVYANTKLYLCFSFHGSYSGVAGIVGGVIRFEDEGNLAQLYNENQSIAYDSVAPAINYIQNNIEIKNFWFSRIMLVQYDYMKFIGYRITLD